VYFQPGRYRAAEEQYQRSLTLVPSDWDRAFVYHQLVLLYLKKGNLRQAETFARAEFKYQKNEPQMGGPLLVAPARNDLPAAAKWKAVFESRSSASPNTR